MSGGSEVSRPDPCNVEWADLLRRIGAGDQEAFDRLYDQSSALVYSVALRIVGDRHAAEEVTLDVFLQVWNDAGRFDPSRGRAMTWVTLLARSRAIDRRRSTRRTRRAEDSLERAAEASDERPGPETISELLEARQRVRAALGSLPPVQRELIELAWFHGLSHSQIAEKLGQPLGTVKTRIRTGMTTLRQVLEPTHSERGS